MLSFSRIDRHSKLVSTMADRNGADVAEAVLTGDLTPENLRSAVLSCTGCSDPDACEAFLASGQTGIPSYCRNAGLIAEIAKGG